MTDFNNAKDGGIIDWTDLLFSQLPSKHEVAIEPSKPDPAPTSVSDLSDSGSPSGTDRLSTYDRGEDQGGRGGNFPHIFQWSSSEVQRTQCRKFVTIRSPPGGRSTTVGSTGRNLVELERSRR